MAVNTRWTATARWKGRGIYHLIFPMSIMDGSIQNSYRLGRRPGQKGPRHLLSNQGRDEKLATGRGNSNGKVQIRKTLRIGTWNVRSMLQLGKVQVLGEELERNKVDICGLAEVRWEGQGHFTTSDGHTIVYSGGEHRGQRGVAIWISRKIGGNIEEYRTVNDRILMVRVNAKPRNISIIQVYAPTTTNLEEDIDRFYGEVEKIIRKVPRRDILIVMGDFNAKVGKQTTDEYATVVGKGGLGTGNEAGERLVEFCLDNELRLCNTWFEHHPRRLYTWTSPDGKTRNQIDYIAIAQKWADSIRNCKAYPGADCDSDHNLIIAKLKIKLIKKRNVEQTKRLNIEDLYGQKAEE